MLDLDPHAVIAQNAQIDENNHSNDFDLVLGLDAITDLGHHEWKK